MADKKETQVFDQSDLDNLMAEIQEAETDSNADAVEDVSTADAEVAEAEAPPGPSANTDIEETDPDEASTAPVDKTLAQQDLDGLIDELQNDADDQTEGPASEPDEQREDSDPAADSLPEDTAELEEPKKDTVAPAATDDVDGQVNIKEEGNPTEDHSPADNTNSKEPKIDAAAPPRDDSTDDQTINQSELEALIKELQEGVETPEIEQLQETVENQTTIETPANTDNTRLKVDQGVDTQESTNEQPAVAAPDTLVALKTTDPETLKPQESEKETAAPNITQDPFEGHADTSPAEASAASSEENTDNDQLSTDVDDSQTPDEAPIVTGQLSSTQAQEKQTAVNQQVHPQDSRRRLVAGLIIGILLITLASVVLSLKLRTKPMHEPAIELSRVEKPAIFTTEAVEDNRPIINANEVPRVPVDRVALIETRLEEVSALRDDLLTKQDEVLALKQHYQDGISAIQKEIREEQRKRGIKSYPRAIRNNRIELGLQTIQRRMAYIQQLNKPLAWLANAGEELLYTNRLISIDLRMLDTVSGIDLKEFEAQTIEAIETYQPSVGRLAISDASTAMPPLKSIWEQMFPSTRGRPAQQVKSVRSQTDGRNQVIWREICQSDYQHKTELTALSPEAAKCLALAKEADLFLNGVTTLTPDAAKNLTQWEGNWLCLNGVTQISSETARYLFSWNGNWISLNGLQELRAEAARYLVQWPGRQLELMGLDFKGQPHELYTLTYLAQWKQSGGKLYVPDNIEKQIDKLME